MRSHTDGSGVSHGACQRITCIHATKKRKYSGLDTVLEGPDQLNQALAAHLAQDDRAFPCCARRFHYVFPPPFTANGLL